MPSFGPPTLVLDIVRGAELAASREQASYLRTGYVENIDLTELPDPDALVKVLQVLQDNGHPFQSSLGPNSGNMRLARVRVRPSDAKIRRANLELVYETAIVNGESIYLLRDRTYTVQKNTCFMSLPTPQGGMIKIPILVGFRDPNSLTGTIAPEPVFVNLNMSARSLQLTTLVYGRPTAGTADYVNYVNSHPWPGGGIQVFNGQVLPTATGRPAGYWRLNSYSTEHNRNAGTTLVQAEAVTLNTEDWSEVAMMRHEATGRYPFPGLPTADRLSIYTALSQPAYMPGPIYPPLNALNESHRGIMRFGPYPTTDFTELFGF